MSETCWTPDTKCWSYRDNNFPIQGIFLVKKNKIFKIKNKKPKILIVQSNKKYTNIMYTKTLKIHDYKENQDQNSKPLQESHKNPSKFNQIIIKLTQNQC